MFKICTIVGLLILVIVEVLSVSLHMDVEEHRKEDTINTQLELELLNSRIENLSLKVALLEAKLALSSSQLVEDFTELNKNNLQLTKATQLSEKNHLSAFNDLMNYNSKAQLPSTCADETLRNLKDGIYLLQLPGVLPFKAYCMHEKANLRAWTIIQRREDGSENFYRNWSDYKEGFGDLNGEYWMGLDLLHKIIKDQPHELWIFLRAYNGTTRYAKYSQFSIANESRGYELFVDGYIGDAGDSLSKHNNMKFSTHDRNNNLYNLHCARAFKGGWWYIDCYFCNLNGVYYSFANRNTGNGLNWNSWIDTSESLKYVHMAIRPVEQNDSEF